MPHDTVKTMIAAVTLCTVAFACEPALAGPMAGAAAIEQAVPATVAGLEQVRFHHGFHHGPHRGFHHGFHGRRFGFHHGLPGHPIRRILRAL